MIAKRTTFAAAGSVLVLLGGSGAALAASQLGSHQTNPRHAVRAARATKTPSTTTTPSTAPTGAPPGGHNCPGMSSSSSVTSS